MIEADGLFLHLNPLHEAFQANGTTNFSGLLKKIENILSFNHLGYDTNIGIIFLYLLGFYAALIAVGASPWLSLLGALAFGLGSYNIIIIEAGHITKAYAMSMMAPMLGSMLLILKRRKYLWGGILFALALGIQIACNHIQITYYTMLVGVILGMVYLVYAIKDKAFKPLLVGVGVMLSVIWLRPSAWIRQLEIRL